MLQNDCERLSEITSYVCNLHLTNPAAKAAIQHIIQLAAGPPSEDIISTEALSHGSTLATFNSSTDYFGFMEEGNYMDLEAEPLIAVYAEPAAAEIQKPGCSYAQHR